MKKKLWLNAFLISPIIALYAASPAYFVDNLSLSFSLLFFAIITVATLILWAAHIYLALNLPHLHLVWKFLIAHTVIFLTRLISQAMLPFEDLSRYSIENQHLAYSIFISLLPNAVIMILCLTIVADFKRNAAEKEVQELRLQNSEAQKLVLTQQLQPHFLFNALGVLKSLISTNEKKAVEYTIRLSHFLQYSIHSQKEDVVILEKELEFVRDYIALQEVRFEDAFSCSIDIPPAVFHHKIPIFALQTLVENIFKHNHFTKKRPLHFSITYLQGNLMVSNIKIPAKHVEQNHTGLSNLNNRYLLITDKGIIINQTEDNFTVIIPTIP
ncbi:sensor histidine kinase [Flavobacterium soyae]|uniref:sensor histidine kinase n=1 Tax=Flavobacterium soyae TaxID=2903098 RepID=UPI001E283F62|nr:histidine kinase [Flavobacterium soyae]MCD9576228.1 histidine kinase [Flavobacterium soyae]